MKIKREIRRVLDLLDEGSLLSQDLALAKLDLVGRFIEDSKRNGKVFREREFGATVYKFPLGGKIAYSTNLLDVCGYYFVPHLNVWNTLGSPTPFDQLLRSFFPKEREYLSWYLWQGMRERLLEQCYGAEHKHKGVNVNDPKYH